jgi:hypothetical protein
MCLAIDAAEAPLSIMPSADQVPVKSPLYRLSTQA